MDHIGEAVASLAFTKDGLESFIAAAPNQAAFGIAEARCGRPDAAAGRLRRLSGSVDAEDMVFAYELSRQMPGFNAAGSTASQMASRPGARGAPSSWSAVLSGMMELDLGHTQEGRALLESALLLPDRNLAHHFAREALRGIAGKL